MRYALAVFILFCLKTTASVEDYEDIDIGILRDYRPEVVQIIPEKGAYALIADGKNLGTLRAGDRVSLSLTQQQIKVNFPKENLGNYRDVRLMALNDSSFFRIYLLAPNPGEQVYDDHLLVKPTSQNLLLINRVDLEKYIAGVVEAETGKEKNLEFYKVQAVISRTYALSNRRKHLSKGFNLSDGVDSQVYHGKCRWEPLILQAVDETQGKVLVDSEMKLITAAFHSNSGGETIGSEMVWSGPLPYLSPRKDEFSRMGEHYNWEVTIEKSEWLEYLRDSFKLPIEDKLISMMATNYEQKNRQVYFIDPVFGVPLTKIRADYDLNSTYFDITEVGDSVRFEGRGFGHGAGLSQEGAMRMADLGFLYTDILHFYYDDVHLIDLRALEFFRKE